jgi:hypothetical protein
MFHVNQISAHAAEKWPRLKFIHHLDCLPRVLQLCLPFFVSTRHTDLSVSANNKAMFWFQFFYPCLGVIVAIWLWKDWVQQSPVNLQIAVSRHLPLHQILAYYVVEGETFISS